MSEFFLVGAGVVLAGAIGTLLRVAITDLDADFDRQLLGTFTVNIVGSFALGLVSTIDGNAALVVGVGGIGALTTFSTFISQVESLNREATHEKAAAYVLASAILGVSAALAGIALGS